MSITYQLTRKDIIYASLASLLQQPIAIAFFGVAFLFISYQNWTSISSDYSLFVKLLTFGILELIPVVFIGGIIFLLVLLTTLSQRNRTMLTKQTLTLTDNLLICESEYVKSELKWKAVQRVVPAKNYVFLYLSELGAMLVPKHAFSSKDQWENFIQYCIAKTQENS